MRIKIIHYGLRESCVIEFPAAQEVALAKRYLVDGCTVRIGGSATPGANWVPCTPPEIQPPPKIGKAKK